MNKIRLLLAILALTLGLSGALQAQQNDDASEMGDSIRFAVIGDFGSGNQDEQDVADLVDSWDVDFIITTGDNYYRPALGFGGNGLNQFDNSVGKYYCRYLKDTGLPDTGNLDCPPEQQSETINRFFPTIGNHDRHDTQSQGVTDYLNYFNVPGTGFENSSGSERYYEFVQGPVHFFALDSDTARREADDLAAQKTWLKEQLQSSSAAWNVVYFHQSAYSSANHGSDPVMQWPFQEWGADVVFQGHDHVYERILRDDMPYFISGNGGRHLYEFDTAISGSVVRFDSGFGAMLVTADETSMDLESWGIHDDRQERIGVPPTLVDYYHLPAVQEGCTTANAAIRRDIDDAVQDQETGRIDLSTTELVMVQEDDSIQTVGLRFENVLIPPDMTIHEATIEFTAREYETALTNLVFYGQDADSAPSFTPTYGDIGTRTRTEARVEWNEIAEWHRTSPRTRYLTPDLSPIVQEIVDREGWASGNAMAFIIDGSGRRVAYAYDHGIQDPALLSILFCKTADIGDEVWVDLDDDGVHNPEESPRAGVTVKLWNTGGDGRVGGEDDQMVSTTVSGNQGYGFYNLDPGTYFVEFVRPDHFQFVQSKGGQEGEQDSAVDPGSGLSEVFQFDETPVRNVDAGLTPDPPAVEVTTSSFLARNWDVLLPWLLVVILGLVIVTLLVYILWKRRSMGMDSAEG